MFHPNAGAGHGHLFREDYDLFILNDDLSLKLTWQKHNFWRRFLRSCEPSEISLVASSHNIRVFTVDGFKWLIYLFASNSDAFDIIRSSPLMLSGVCWITQGRRFYDEELFAKILSMAGFWGMEVVTDCDLDPLKRGSISMNCRRYSVRHSEKIPDGFNGNVRSFMVERD